MICSECGGDVTSSTHLVYRIDGGSSGEYRCFGCGRTKEWRIPGYKVPKEIDMSDE